MDGWTPHEAEKGKDGGFFLKSKEICEIAVNTCLSEGASDVVVCVSEIEETMIRFSNNQITVAKKLNETSAEVFAKVRERKAGTSIVDLSSRSIVSSCKKLMGEVKRSPPGDFYTPLPQGPFKYRDSLLDQGEFDQDPDLMIGWVDQAIEAGLEEGAKRMAGSLICRNTFFTLQTSAGVCGTVRKPTVELSIRAFGSDQSSGHSVSVAADANNFRPEAAGREAGSLASIAYKPESIQPGEYDAVLGHMVMADIVQQVGRFSSAFYVEAGISFFKDRINEQVGSEELTVIDDPTLEGSYGAFPFDMEGLPTKRKSIVERGVFKTYLHNTTTASKMNTESTANAGLINPQPFNLIVEGGKDTTQDLISQVDRGIFVSNDWYLRYQNWSTGDFSMIPRDAMFLIEKGELKKPIKEMRISDNILRMLKNVSCLSEDRKWIKWWEVEVPTLTPSAIVESTRFTKSTM